MLKPDRLSCSQKFQLKWDPPVPALGHWNPYKVGY